jgi:large subunit ribosomal protein L4e
MVNLKAVQIYDLEGNSKETIELPRVFDTPLRPDVAKRAVLAQQSHRIQPQGRDAMAGTRTTAISMGTGHGMARLPRVKGSRYSRAQQGAFAPSAVGGRLTHPPRSEKNIYKAINKKERRLAIRSAIAATANRSLVASRGHVVDGVPELPLVVADEFQDVAKAREARQFFRNLGLWPDLERVKAAQKIRAGKGKMRGRKRRHGVGPLLVIHEDRGIRGAVRNFPGIDVVKVNELNSEVLAPGTVLGRLTVWVSSALKGLDALFM